MVKKRPLLSWHYFWVKIWHPLSTDKPDNCSSNHLIKSLRCVFPGFWHSSCLNFYQMSAFFLGKYFEYLLVALSLHYHPLPLMSFLTCKTGRIWNKLVRNRDSKTSFSSWLTSLFFPHFLNTSMSQIPQEHSVFRTFLML